MQARNNATSLYVPFSNDKRVGILDLLRSLAIIFVVITHFKYDLLPGGSVGVSIFFCLSGYLITRNLLQKKVSIPDFLIHRIFRIYPAFFIICILHLLVLYIIKVPNYQNYVEALPNILLIIKMPDSWLGFGVGVFWSLQVELWFYFLIPFIIKKPNASIRISAIIALIVLSFILKFLVFFEIIKLSSYSLFRTFYWMDNLLYGTIAALILEKTQQNVLIESSVTKQGFIIKNIFLILTFLAILAVAVFIPSIGKQWPFESSLVSILTGLIILGSQKYKLLNYKMPKIISYFSLFAYTIYLLHPFPLDYYIAYRYFFKIPNLEYKILGGTILILLILLLHNFIEKPGIKLGKKLSVLLLKHPSR
jgi:peptidoglycan/LPS O-acetylase OafA/YrhL